VSSVYRPLRGGQGDRLCRSGRPELRSAPSPASAGEGWGEGGKPRSRRLARLGSGCASPLTQPSPPQARGRGHMQSPWRGGCAVYAGALCPLSDSTHGVDAVQPLFMSFGSDFATESGIVAHAFRSVVGRTSIPRDVAERLEPIFMAAHRSGSSREEARCTEEHLAPVTWRWPWFEEWVERFRTLSIEPYLWRSIRDEIDHRDQGDADIRPRLLGFTISMRAYRIRDIVVTLRIPDRRWPRLSVVGGCPAEDLTAREVWPAIARGDLALLPPVFPGDRTSLQWLTARDIERRPTLYRDWMVKPAEPVTHAALLAVVVASALGPSSTRR
jgi:hypothetical protein